MAHRVVTANTTRLRIVNFGVRAFNSLHNFLVTFPASLFSHRPTTRRDVNVVFIPAGREIVRVPKAVARLGHVLGNKTRRRMTIIADSDSAMTRLDPPAKLVLHDMAVYASFSIVGHVGVAAGINERVRPHAHGQTERDTQNYPAYDFSIDYHALSRLTASGDGIRHTETLKCRQG